MPRVLLVDDDRDLVGVLRYTFQRDGYAVSTAFDGDDALRAIQTDSPDLVVLDMRMPRRRGMDVLREMSSYKNLPVIVLTALGDEDNIVNALALGADDYVVKPFRPRELRARARALLRRSRGKVEAKDQPAPTLALGDVTLDPATRDVRVLNRPVQLTRTEFALLHYLMNKHDTVVGIPDIVGSVWGYDAEENDEVVKVTVSRLRRKLEPDPANPRYVLNVPGAGYKFQTRAREE